MEKEKEVPCLSVQHRKILNMAISSILVEKGFETAEKACVETLTEIIQSLIVEIGQSSRNYCELAGRTTPFLGDVVVALVNMGVTLQSMESFAKRESRQIVPPPQQISQQKQLNLLQVGTKSNHPSYIPSHLPVLPDPHAYVRTPTHKQPVTEYEAIREKAASQKRDIEKALTKFLAKTSATQSLFDTEDNVFPLIACKPSVPAYLAALNPTDQVFDFEELEYHYLVANRTEDVTSKDNENDDENEDENENETKPEKQEKDVKVESEPAQIKSSAINNAILNNPNIDNPYLRAASLPRKGKIEMPNVPNLYRFSK